jgi:hypothetical protein
MTRQGLDLWTTGIIATVWTATAIGVILNSLPNYRIIPATNFFPVAVIFSLFTMINLMIALWISLPRPYPRTSFRFTINSKLRARINNSVTWVHIDNMSTGGVGLAPSTSMILPERIEIELTDQLWLPAVIIRLSGGVGLRWEPLSAQHYRALVEFLFSGRFRANPDRAGNILGIYSKLLKSI